MTKLRDHPTNHKWVVPCDIDFANDPISFAFSYLVKIFYVAIAGGSPESGFAKR